MILSSRTYDPGCSSRIRILIFYPSRIPDPGVEKTPDPGSGSATLVGIPLVLGRIRNFFIWSDPGYIIQCCGLGTFWCRSRGSLSDFLLGYRSQASSRRATSLPTHISIIGNCLLGFWWQVCAAKARGCLLSGTAAGPPGNSYSNGHTEGTGIPKAISDFYLRYLVERIPSSLPILGVWIQIHRIPSGSIRIRRYLNPGLQKNLNKFSAANNVGKNICLKVQPYVLNPREAFSPPKICTKHEIWNFFLHLGPLCSARIRIRILNPDPGPLTQFVSESYPSFIPFPLLHTCSQCFWSVLIW